MGRGEELVARLRWRFLHALHEPAIIWRVGHFVTAAALDAQTFLASQQRHVGTFVFEGWRMRVRFDKRVRSASSRRRSSSTRDQILYGLGLIDSQCAADRNRRREVVAKFDGSTAEASAQVYKRVTRRASS